MNTTTGAKAKGEVNPFGGNGNFLLDKIKNSGYKIKVMEKNPLPDVKPVIETGKPTPKEYAGLTDVIPIKEVAPGGRGYSTAYGYPGQPVKRIRSILEESES